MPIVFDFSVVTVGIMCLHSDATGAMNDKINDNNITVRLKSGIPQARNCCMQYG